MAINPIRLSQIPLRLDKVYAKHTIGFPGEKLSRHTEEASAKMNQDKEQHCSAFYLPKSVCFYTSATKSTRAETLSYLLLYLQCLERYLENIQQVVIDA